MARFDLIQTSFKAGEVSEKLYGRRDFEEYRESLEQMENYFVVPQGGATKRPGSRYSTDLSENAASGAFQSRIIPFIFSKDEAYNIHLAGGTISGNFLRIFDQSGTEVTDISTTYLQSDLSSYDPVNWKYTQSGDFLILTYASDTSTIDALSTDEVISKNEVAQVFIQKLKNNKFRAFSFGHPGVVELFVEENSGYPATAATRPYLPANINPDLRIYLSAVTVGGGRILNMVDSSNNPTPYFTRGHSYSTSGGTARIGAYFKINDGANELVCYPTNWELFSDINGAINVSVGNDTINLSTLYSGSAVIKTGDLIRFVNQAGGGFTLSGYSASSGEAYGDFYVNDQGGALGPDNFTMHPTLADAKAGTNTINITAQGSGDTRAIPIARSQTVCVVEATNGTLTASSAANAVDNWEESAWSSERGFPRAATFFNGRLIFGGTIKEPGGVWCSFFDNLFVFMQRRLQQDSSAPETVGYTLSGTTGQSFILFGNTSRDWPFNFPIASNQANIIQWMNSTEVIKVGTRGAEYIISDDDNGFGPATADLPISVSIRKQTEYGSNNAQPFAVNDSVMFVSRDGRLVRDFKYNRNNGSYVSTNISRLADHMVFKGFGGASTDDYKGIEFKEIYFHQHREILFALTTNNVLVGITFSKEMGVAGWHYHPFASGTKILSMCVLPNADATSDRLWLLVERTINSTVERYLEFIGDDFEHSFINNTSSSDEDTPFYVDSAIKVTLGSTTDTVTGLSHLEGETVDALAGNTIEKGLTVSSGQITLSQTYATGTVVVVGLRYTSRLKTMDIEAGSRTGTSDGQRQRIDRVALRMYKSQGGSYGNENASSLFDIEYDDSETFTGIKRLDFEITPDMENKVVIEHDDPVPFNINSMTYRGTSYE